MLINLAGSLKSFCLLIWIVEEYRQIRDILCQISESMKNYMTKYEDCMFRPGDGIIC